MKEPERGEVWLVDLGLAAKIRPCLVLSVPLESQDRSLVCLVPHTTSIRNSRFEVAVPKPFLKAGAFDPQGLIAIARPRLIRFLGKLTLDEFELVQDAVKRWLGF